MEHYYSEKPTAPRRDNVLIYIFQGHEFKFHTSTSVFSKKKIDKGTELLIMKSKIEENSDILDLGCGYGPVGVIISRMHPKCQVVMSDINERAILFSKKNLSLNNTTAKVIRSNLYDDINGKFDTILSNPPQSAGKQVCFDIIEGAPAHLRKNGSLQLVARHQKGGKDLSRKMESIFGNVESIARKSGYHVYYSCN
jgi:16S rRNA G1207 methylase RsmC